MKPLERAGVVLGLRLGGFVDGIVFHQLLGWHHLVCRTETCTVYTVGALRAQVRGDGYFHLATLALTVWGIALLFQAARRELHRWSGRVLVGAMLFGWGTFNVVEGVIDHQLLAIHHVRPGHAHELAFDLLFLAAGAGLMLLGLGCARPRAARDPDREAQYEIKAALEPGAPSILVRAMAFFDRYFRWALAFIFVWFGALKLAGVSPMAPLLSRTFAFVPDALLLPAMGAWELAIGLALLWRRTVPLALLLLAIQLPSTFLPLILAPQLCFRGNPLLLTNEGEFIIKNLVLIGATLLIARVHRAEKRSAKSLPS